jgi:hypothetical protein
MSRSNGVSPRAIKCDSSRQRFIRSTHSRWSVSKRCCGPYLPPIRSSLQYSFGVRRRCPHDFHSRIAEVGAALRAQLAARRSQHFEYEKALIDVQGKLFDAQPEKERAAQSERFQTVKDKSHALFAMLQEVEVKQNDEIAESVRRLAQKRARPRQLSRKLRGVGPLFTRKSAASPTTTVC